MPTADRNELARLVSDRAAGVAQEAMRIAHDTAVQRLSSLLADALVTAALDTLAPAEPSTPARTRDGPPAVRVPAARTVDGSSRPDEGLYCYGITWAGTAMPPARSLTGQGRATLLPDGDLALVVSRERLAGLDVDEDDLSEEGDLARLVRGHDAVVRAVFEHAAVLPLRFATVVEDEAGAQQLLRAHADVARERLRHVEGATEWGLRLVRAPATSAGGVEPGGRPDGTGPSARAGTEYLARRREALRAHQADNEIAALAADKVAAELDYTVDVIHRGGSAGSALLLDAAYLVATATEARFRADTDRLARELIGHGLHLELTGPWPPYSFATLAQEVTDAHS
ncbi:MAG TPA: GvpL/GvpF family gas vesicle protein [Actinomycetes bacterium]|nr:GvpL/GvpF family gas vesicle protein [Actinomycetes bacterium]